MEYKAVYPCDLHAHSVRSDGNDTYEELVTAAVAAGIKVLAITDHDIVAAKTVSTADGEIPLAEYGRANGIRLLPGIEFSCDTLVEDVHIIALGCDFDNPLFEVEYQRSITSKIDGYKKLCELLTNDGKPIDWEQDVLANDGHPIAETEVQRKRIFEAIARRGYCDDWSSAKLMVKNTPAYHVPREKPDPISIIELIHRTGGIAILAHPYLISDPCVLDGQFIPRAVYIERLLAAGLDGIEASYPYDKTSYGGSQTPEEIESEILREYRGRVKILSGGSDYHNEAKKGGKHPRMLGERGVTEEYFTHNELFRRICKETML